MVDWAKLVDDLATGNEEHPGEANADAGEGVGPVADDTAATPVHRPLSRIESLPPTEATERHVLAEVAPSPAGAITTPAPLPSAPADAGAAFAPEAFATGPLEVTDPARTAVRQHPLLETPRPLAPLPTAPLSTAPLSAALPSAPPPSAAPPSAAPPQTPHLRSFASEEGDPEDTRTSPFAGQSAGPWEIPNTPEPVAPVDTMISEITDPRRKVAGALSKAPLASSEGPALGEVPNDLSLPWPAAGAALPALAPLPPPRAEEPPPEPARAEDSHSHDPDEDPTHPQLPHVGRATAAARLADGARDTPLVASDEGGPTEPALPPDVSLPALGGPFDSDDERTAEDLAHDVADEVSAALRDVVRSDDPGGPSGPTLVAPGPSEPRAPAAAEPDHDAFFDAPVDDDGARLPPDEPSPHEPSHYALPTPSASFDEDPSLVLAKSQRRSRLLAAAALIVVVAGGGAAVAYLAKGEESGASTTVVFDDRRDAPNLYAPDPEGPQVDPPKDRTTPADTEPPAAAPPSDEEPGPAPTASEPTAGEPAGGEAVAAVTEAATARDDDDDEAAEARAQEDQAARDRERAARDEEEREKEAREQEAREQEEREQEERERERARAADEREKGREREKLKERERPKPKPTKVAGATDRAVAVVAPPQVKWLTPTGKKLGKGSGFIQVPAGVSTVLALDPETDARTFVKVTDEGQLNYHRLPRGTLDIRVFPYADVYAGKKKIGTAPFPPLEVVEGQYRLKLVYEGRTERRTVKVQGGRTTRVKVTFNP